MTEPLTYRGLLPKFAKIWLAMLVYVFGLVALVSLTKAPFWVAQVGMGVAAVAMFLWFRRTFGMGKRFAAMAREPPEKPKG